MNTPDHTPVQHIITHPGTCNALLLNGIATLEHLTRCSAAQLLSLDGIGQTQLTRITAALQSRNLLLRT